MRVISIGTDRKIFDENSAVRQRQIEYSKLFEETYIIVFSMRKSQILNTKYQISENVWVYPTNSISKLLYIIDAFKIANRIIHNSKSKISDYVVSCQDPFETGVVGVLLKLFYGLPLHMQVHTDFMHKYFSGVSLLNKLRFLMAEFILRYSDRVRVVSGRVKQSIEKFSKNIDILPIKIKSQIMNYGLHEEKEIKNILTVCRLEKEKNLEIAIKAFKIISKKFPDTTFTIVGDGSEKNKLEILAKNLELENKINFVGWKNNLEEYYKNADIYISTSLYEGYGISMIEAALSGLSLVISDTGLAGDVFANGESAFVCDAFDTKCFAESIIKLCEDKDLAKKMRNKAKEMIQRHLNSNDNYYEKYAESVKKAAQGFENKNFFLRVINFKIIFWYSFIYLRYFVCGIIAAATNLFSLYVFTEFLGIWYLYSSVLAFLLALFLSFVLQKFVVFKDKRTDKLHNQFTKFFIAAVLGVASNTLLVFVFTDIFGVWYVISQIIAGFFVMIQNFILYKFFIFNK